MFSVNGGEMMDVKSELYRTEGGSIINYNPTGIGQVATLFSAAGDGLSLGGAAATSSGVLAPAGGMMMAIGGILSGIGTVVELTDDYNNGALTPEKVATKAALTVAPDVIGAAGKGAIRPGEEALVNTLTTVADKTLDDGRDNNKGPYKDE